MKDKEILEREIATESQPSTKKTHWWKGGLAFACLLAACVTNPEADDKVKTPEVPFDPKEEVVKRVSELPKADTKTRLKDFLDIMQVPVSSQVFVYSRTSHQIYEIGPKTPRALYFSDDAYVGWVQKGLVEYSQAEPTGGTGYWVLDLDAEHPKFISDPEGACLRCHGDVAPRHGPGLMLRSMMVDSKGNKVTGTEEFMVDHSTPLEKRWGGWYVTGNHGDLQHMGNIVLKEFYRSAPEDVEREPLSNLKSLDKFFDTEPYLYGGKSDIVALMVYEHQLMAHNAITQAGLHFSYHKKRYEEAMASLGEKADWKMSSTLRIMLKNETERICRILLFKDEAPLPKSGLIGDPQFQKDFRKNRRSNSRGNSLKDFDMKTRMFKYRCSYSIHSRAFRLMPKILQEAVCQRLMQALSTDGDKLSRHIPKAERDEIISILLASEPTYPWSPEEVGKTDVKK